MKQRLSFTLLVLLAIASCQAINLPIDDLAVEFDPIGRIHEHLESMKSPKQAAQPLCDTVPCCTLSEKERCSLDSMNGEITAIIPGGRTSCLYGDEISGPFAFEVLPGNRSKLLFYFGGGGACWDKWSTDQGLCYSEAEGVPLAGIFDKNDESNRYRDWTIVGLLYCSGDMFVSNLTRSYTSKDGYPVIQRGLENALAVIDWVKEQKLDIQEFTVMGCSAGALAAQLWSSTLFETFDIRGRGARAAVVSDSYGGVFPSGTVAPMCQDYGMCDSELLSPQLQAKCRSGTITVEDINESAFQAYPEIPHTFIQSKTDSVQKSFYMAVALTNGMLPVITNAGFYRDINSIFSTYNKHANFVTFLLDGSEHCFTPFSEYYTATPAPGVAEPVVASWVNQLPLDDHSSISSVCSGPSSVLQGSTTWCDPSIAKKTFP